MILASSRTQHPGFLRSILEELRLFGNHEQLTRHLEGLLESTSNQELLMRIFLRIEADFELSHPGRVAETLRLIRCSRLGLSEGEVRMLLGSESSPFPQTRWLSLRYGVVPSNE